jgi:hypothetical protein
MNDCAGEANHPSAPACGSNTARRFGGRSRVKDQAKQEIGRSRRQAEGCHGPIFELLYSVSTHHGLNTIAAKKEKGRTDVFIDLRVCYSQV